ncbi:XRE family transcriptional regulator [Streptomyces sp. NPDC048565]|uniref:nSTAND1 domain-containing NTPase n=1 Tax=Streptomyces sp. NPDC048565 TaxID=3155266 RepID=UPI003416B4ED
MPRRERPLDAGDSELLRLASELRLLRQRAGSPTYRELARRAHYSVATLSAAAAGGRLPSLAVTVAYAAACGGDPADWEKRWHAVAAEVAREEAAARPATAQDEGSVSARPPYAGLSVFRTEDADRFFGRERLVDEVTRRLGEHRLVAVVGASGAGKSSLLRAGLIPRRQASHPGSPFVFLTPGAYPWEECATRFAGLTGSTPGALVRDLADDPRALHRVVRQALAGLPDDAELLLVVDQFEEVFTVCRDAEERAGFIDALMTATSAGNSRCRVVVGVRADFYAHCANHAELGRAMSEAQVLVGPMTTDELRRAITEPAAQAGCRVEGALVADLVSSAKGQTAVLPLLSHVLLETWRRRRGNTLTLTGFHATGGIDGGLAHTAEGLYSTLSPAQQRAARDLLLRLTALGEGTEDTRRRIRRTELDLDEADTALVLEQFVRARLLTLDRDSIEITHEALIRCWPRLHSWLLEDRESLRIHRALTEATQVWEAVEQDPGALYRGVRLARTRQWAQRGDAGKLSPRERAFLHTSIAAQVSEEATAGRRARRLRHLTVLLAVLLAGTVAATGFAWRAEQQATRQRDIAVSQQVADQSSALRSTDPARALQLGLVAYRLHPTTAARGTVLSSYATPYATQLSGDDQFDAVAYHPGGRILAAAGQDHVVRLWNVADPYRPRRLAALTGHTGDVRSAAFSPDGRLLASAGEDGTVRLWDVTGPAQPKARAVLTPVPAPGRGQGAALASVAFSPDSRTVASAGADGTVQLWHTTSRGHTSAYAALPAAHGAAGRHERLDSVAFSPDGRTLAASGPDGVSRWSAAAGAPGRPRYADRTRISTDPSLAVAFGPGGRTLATAGADHTVRLWNTSGSPADRPLSVLTGHTDIVETVTFSPDGRTLASGGADGKLRLWNVADPARPDALLTLTGHIGSIPSAAFSPDGRTLASAGEDHTTRLWVLPGPLLLGHTSSLYAAGFSPDGRTVATGGFDNTVRLWNVADPYRPKPLSVLTGHTAAVNDVVFAPGKKLLATASLDRTIRLWETTDPGNPRPLARLTGHSGAVNALAFSPDGHILASAAADHTVRLWDMADARHPKPLTVLRAHRDQVETVAFSPDGRTLASGSRDRTIRLWDTARPGRPRPLARLTGHRDAVKALAFSPRDHVLASAGDDRTIRLWDVADRLAPGVIATPGSHPDGIRALAFSPDGRILASAENNGRLWNVRDPRHPDELAVLSGHTKSVDAVAFSPDGHTLVTGSEDWTALLWDVDADRVARRICRTAGDQALTPADARQYLPGIPYRVPCASAR